MRIIVEEEYGYKYYMWTTPFENTEDLIRWWNGVNPESIIESVFPVGAETSGKNHQRILVAVGCLVTPKIFMDPAMGTCTFTPPKTLTLKLVRVVTL